MLKEEKCSTSPAKNIKPESWVSYFQSLGEIDNKFEERASQSHQLVQHLENQPVINNLDRVITIEEIYKAVNKLKNNKAADIDSISNEMLKGDPVFLGSMFIKTL